MSHPQSGLPRMFAAAARSRLQESMMRPGSLLGFGLVALTTGLGALLLAPSARAQAEAAPAPTGAASSAAPASTDAPPPAPSGSEDPSKKAPPAAAATGGGVTVTLGGPAPTPSPANPTPASGDKKDDGAKPEEKKDPPPTAGTPFKGSVVVFDQSITANSLNKDAQLSYQPIYEWWISPRLVYNFNKNFKVSVRQDLFKEWTNSQDDFKSAHEWRYTDTWLSAGLSDKTPFHDKMRWGVGALVRPGISLSSRASGLYMSTGLSGNISWAIDLAGEKAKAFQSMNLSLGLSYQHAFTKCNTACGLNDDMLRPRQYASGALAPDDQTRPSTMTGNTLMYSLSGSVDIIEKLSFSTSVIYISGFSYAPSPATVGGTTIAPAANDTRLRQSSWYLFDLSYSVMKEFDLSLGYYNFAGVLGPDGKYRNPFYSPDARVFFDVTFKVDAIIDTVAGTKKPAATAKKPSAHF